MATTSSASSGIGFFGLLTILFIGLKLTGYINWSWWLVLLPFYGSIAFTIFVMILVVAIFVLSNK